MSTTTKQTTVALWHYQCPECGIGDGETGYHAVSHALYCEVCVEDGQRVRLRRWPVDQSVDHGSGALPAGRSPDRG